MSKLTIEVETMNRDEVRGAIAILQTALDSPGGDAADADTGDQAPSDAEWADFIDDLWERLGRNARALLKAQAEFPVDEYWPSEALADRLDVSVAQLTGKRANLGRSLKATADELGVEVGDYDISEYKWDAVTDDRWLYRLPSGAHKAIANR